MGGVQVRKRDDGSMQPFDRNKVYSSLTAAGANSNEAECLTVLMEHWVTRNVQDIESWGRHCFRVVQKTGLVGFLDNINFWLEFKIVVCIYIFLHFLRKFQYFLARGIPVINNN